MEIGNCRTEETIFFCFAFVTVCVVYPIHNGTRVAFHKCINEKLKQKEEKCKCIMFFVCICIHDNMIVSAYIQNEMVHIRAHAMPMQCTN